MDEPGYVDGRYYTTYVDEVRRLKRAAQFDQAERLLLRLVDAAEEEARATGCGVAPCYYAQLGIIYTKLKPGTAQLKILQRDERQGKAPGDLPAKNETRVG